MILVSYDKSWIGLKIVVTNFVVFFVLQRGVCGIMLLLLLLLDAPLLCTTFHVLEVSHPETGPRKNM